MYQTHDGLLVCVPTYNGKFLLPWAFVGFAVKRKINISYKVCKEFGSLLDNFQQMAQKDRPIALC